LRISGGVRGFVAEHARAIEDLAATSDPPWPRFAFVVLLLVLVVAALANVFGQRPTTSTASAGAATLAVQAPERVRGGVYFQLRLTVRARRALRHPTVVLDRGWFEQMSVNSIVPQPRERSTNDGRVMLQFGRLAAGAKLVSYLYFQVNPTNVGRRRADVELYDGAIHLASVRRSIVVLP